MLLHAMALPMGSAGVGVTGIDPTTDELNGITSLASALTWPGVSDGLRNRLFEMLGTPTVFRDVAFVGVGDWAAALSSVTITTGVGDAATTRPINGIERGKLGSFRRVCRLRVGLTPGDPDLSSGMVPSQSIVQHSIGSNGGSQS